MLNWTWYQHSSLYLLIKRVLNYRISWCTNDATGQSGCLLEEGCLLESTVYDSVEDLTYVWWTRAWKNYLGMKIIQNDTQSNVFLGNFAHTFWVWHLKASVMRIFLDFCDFMAKFGQKSLFWSDIFFDNAIWSMKK